MKVLRWLDEWAEEFCVSIMLSLLILLLGTEVFSRFLLSKSFSWIEELCRYLFVWASYLGVAIAVKRKEQLRVLMLMDTLEKAFPASGESLLRGFRALVRCVLRACFLLQHQYAREHDPF